MSQEIRRRLTSGVQVQVFVPDAGNVTCTYADHLANILWLGHHDGKVSAHSMGDAPGTAANGQLLHCWQVGLAVRVGSCLFYDAGVLTVLSCLPGSVLQAIVPLLLCRQHCQYLSWL